MLPLLLVSLTILLSSTATPLTSPEDDISKLEAEHRASVSDAFDDIKKQLRDSVVYPILMNPLSVTKLHCGSIITFFDNSPSDGATVSFDVCLTAFIIAKAIFIWELVYLSMNLDRSGESGVFGAVLDKIGEFVASLDLAGTGPDGEPFLSVVDSVENKGDVFKAAEKTPNAGIPTNNNMKEQYTYDDRDYLGFGLDSWKSGPQTFPDIGKFASQFYSSSLPRNFAGKMSFGELLSSTLQELDSAISITEQN